jgi:hypothetical protein
MLSVNRRRSVSLDVTFDALTQFGRQLEIFDAALRASYHELRECHDAVDGLWRDEARRTYDRSMADLESRLSAYLGGECERYEEFIRQKLRQLDAYLNGG